MSPKKEFGNILSQDKKQYFLSFTLRLFGQGIFFIFIPALLYNLGYSIRAIGAYYLFWAAGQLLSNFLASKISHEQGIRSSFATGTPFLLVFLFTTPFIGTQQWLFGISAVSGGIAGALFWAPYHQYLALRTKKGNRGKTISVLWTVTSIATMTSPAIGGVLLDTWGSSITLSIVAGITLLSLIPLWKVKNVKTPKSCTPREAIASFKKFKGFFSVGVTTAGAGMLWPLAFYIVLQEYTLLGVITFVTSLISLIIINIVGWQHDKKDDKKVLKIGSASQGITLIARLLAVNPIAATLIDAIDKIVQKLFWLGVDVESYKLREQDENAILKRETFLHGGIFTLFAFLTITGSLTASFVIAGLTSLFVAKL